VTGEQVQATVFERGSNVHEYWLAHAEGFQVVSRRKPRDRVDHVVVDRELGSATALVVRRKRGRRPKRIPVMSVSAVDPFERVIYLAPKRRAHAAAERLRPHVVEAARSTWNAQQAARDLALPRAIETARATQRECVRAAGWLRPWLAEAGRRVIVAYARGYHAANAFVHSAYAWFQPRVATAGRRAVRAVRNGTVPKSVRARRKAALSALRPDRTRRVQPQRHSLWAAIRTSLSATFGCVGTGLLDARVSGRQILREGLPAVLRRPAVQTADVPEAYHPYSRQNGIDGRQGSVVASEHLHDIGEG
jgi:hypothetical protein